MSAVISHFPSLTNNLSSLLTSQATENIMDSHMLTSLISLSSQLVDEEKEADEISLFVTADIPQDAFVGVQLIDSDSDKFPLLTVYGTDLSVGVLFKRGYLDGMNGVNPVKSTSSAVSLSINCLQVDFSISSPTDTLEIDSQVSNSPSCLDFYLQPTKGFYPVSLLQVCFQASLDIQCLFTSQESTPKTLTFAEIAKCSSACQDFQHELVVSKIKIKGSGTISKFELFLVHSLERYPNIVECFSHFLSPFKRSFEAFIKDVEGTLDSVRKARLSSVCTVLTLATMDWDITLTKVS